MVKYLVDVNPHTGSEFDNFLAEEGILGEVSAAAQERLLAIQAEETMAERLVSKSGLADQTQAG